MKAIVVGAGLSGAVAAFQLKRAGWDVTVFEERPVVGGNCYDSLSVTGCMVHHYGPHAFHTPHRHIWEFVNQFDEFLPFALHVHARVSGNRIIPIPFNRTSQQIVGEWTPDQIVDEVFRNYSQKQWGCRWEDLPAFITRRVPTVRDSFDSRYHLDLYQGIPKHGYTSLIASMLEGVKVVTSAYRSDWERLPRNLLVYTGRADQFFGTEDLPWRSIDFHSVNGSRLPHNQLNDCTLDTPYTRVIDHSWWPNSDPVKPGDRRNVTLTYEKPVMYSSSSAHSPLYPMPWLDKRGLVDDLRARMKAAKGVVFLGRLATYKYIDMDQAIAAALMKIGGILS